MKKQFGFLIVAITVSFLFLNGCKKSSGGTSKTKTQLITNGSWRLTSAKVPGGTSILNFLDDCQKDNIYTFNADGSGTGDDGALKCNMSDPQTVAFTWNFQANETILFISTPLYTGGNNQFNIISISETSLVVEQIVTVLTIPMAVTFTFYH
jgi:Lipocalin-like domain